MTALPEYRQGQEVEVFDTKGFYAEIPKGVWRAATVVYRTKLLHEDVPGYVITFRDGTRGVFPAAHIRPVSP